MLIKKVKITESPQTSKKGYMTQRHPQIKIGGQYLQNLGFNIRDTIEIYSPQSGILEIRKVN